VSVLTPAQLAGRKRAGWEILPTTYDMTYKSQWDSSWFFIREFYQNALDEHDEAGVTSIPSLGLTAKGVVIMANKPNTPGYYWYHSRITMDWERWEPVQVEEDLVVSFLGNEMTTEMEETEAERWGSQIIHQDEFSSISDSKRKYTKGH